MIVKFYATLRDVTGSREKRVEGYETVGELLKDLAKTYGRDFERLVLKGDGLVQGAMVLVNGTHIAHLQGFDTPLGKDSVIDVFPPVAGG